MLLHIENVLSKDEVADFRKILEASEWVDGRVSAGEQAAQCKRNLQIPFDTPVARELGERVLHALARSPMFTTAALPLRVMPPMFNRYDVGMTFGDHVDNSIRVVGQTGARIRCDVSSTLFLSEPDEYDGGELMVRDTYGMRGVKLPAGDLALYPAHSLHSVTPITRGARWASFFWTQSMIRDDGLRTFLYDLDMSIIEVRKSLSDDHLGVLGITASYHNLLRRWAEM